MSKISIAIYDSQNSLFLDALESLLVSNPDLSIAAKYQSIDEFMANYKTVIINVFILTIHRLTDEKLALLRMIKEQNPSIKVLVLSMNDNEDTLFRVIKSGAGGYLTQNSTRQELFEAVFSLRNGYDYYSKSITGLLLKNYMNTIDEPDKDKLVKNMNGLSSRELEILKYWGEGMTNKELADKLFISIRTVESHKNHIMQKLNMKTMVDVVKFAIKNNIISI